MYCSRAIRPVILKGQEKGAAIMDLDQNLFEHMIYDAFGRPIIPVRVPEALTNLESAP